MEAANAVDPANGEETRVPPVDHVEGAIGDLTNDHKLDAQSNSKIDIADAKSLNGNSENKNKSAEKEPTTEDKPSQRVQEGQRWNDRPRRFNNTNDRTIYKRNNKSDLTSQAESSDPVAIRKQVGQHRMSVSCHGLMTIG